MCRKTLLLIVLLLSAHGMLYGQTDTVLNRYREYLFRTQNPGNTANLMTTLDTHGAWPDINYQNASRSYWQTIQHLERVGQMAVAWANPGSPWYHRDTLWTAISSALDHWLYNRYYNPNWWYNEIGVPRDMGNILTLLGPRLTKYQRIRGLQEMGQYRINGTGSNLVWSAELGFHYGALTGDTSLMRHCVDTILHEIKITTGEGIQPDYSFHMHGNRLQIYSYGTAFLRENIKLAMECKGTPWAFPQKKIDLLTDFVLYGWQWMTRGINTVPGTIDRSISGKEGLHAADIRDLIPQLASLCPVRARELRDFAARQNDGGKPLEGFRYYPYSDFAAYQCKHFGFFLKTISTRSLPSESINGENLKGHLLNSGDGYLIHDGREYFDLMPVWDWNVLPGMTSFRGAEKIIRKPFTGSVSDHKSGMTAMDYEMLGLKGAADVSAHRIWACHDGRVVCLIAGLKASQLNRNVFTALDQCRWLGTVTVNEPSNSVGTGVHILQNVKWVHQGNFAYILLKPATMRLLLDTVSGTWSSLSTAGSDSLLTDSVFLPMLLHGKHPQNLSTGYVLAYAASAERTASLADHPSWEVMRNDTLCQAVLFTDGVLMAAFFHPGTLHVPQGDFIKVDRPCLLLIADDKLYLSDPTHRGGEMHFTIHRHTFILNLPDDGTTLPHHLPTGTS